MRDRDRRRIVLDGVLVSAMGVAVVMPFSESILGWHGSIERVLGVSRLVPYLLALAVSLGIMGIEYALIKKFDRKVMPLFQRWLSRAREFLNSDLEVLEYALLVVCSVNPFPTPPFTRTPGVVLWREAKIAGGGWVIAIGTAVRLAVVYAMTLKIFG